MTAFQVRNWQNVVQQPHHNPGQWLILPFRLDLTSSSAASAFDSFSGWQARRNRALLVLRRVTIARGASCWSLTARRLMKSSRFSRVKCWKISSDAPRPQARPRSFQYRYLFECFVPEGLDGTSKPLSGSKKSRSVDDSAARALANQAPWARLLSGTTSEKKLACGMTESSSANGDAPSRRSRLLPGLHCSPTRRLFRIYPYQGQLLQRH